MSEDAHRDIRLELRADYLVHGKLLLFWKRQGTSAPKLIVVHSDDVLTTRGTGMDIAALLVSGTNMLT